MDVVTVPSHLTDVAHGSDELHRLNTDHSYEGIWYQVQNGGNEPKTYDLDIPKQSGLFGGVWGVTYAVDDRNNNSRGLSFYDQNQILGEKASAMNADCVMVDAEDCLKGTRNSRGAMPMVEGVRAGGWKGPVHLTTLGAPANPEVDDYEFDLQSFLDTGGGVFAQAYVQAHPSYDPKITMKYFVERMKVPVDKYNTMIWYDGRMTAEEHVALLKNASVGRAISIFMLEFGNDAVWDVFDEITTSDEPPETITEEDPRLTLDPILVDLRDLALEEYAQATSDDPLKWIKDNPREWTMLQNYLLHRVAYDNDPPLPPSGYNRPYDPPSDCGTHIGRGMANQLMAAAALLGRY